MSDPEEKSKVAPFTPGEELVYDVTALGMTAGKARISVGSSTDRDGVPAWPLVVQARTDSVFDAIYSVKDRFVSWWDPATGRVVGNEFYADERGKRRRSKSRLDHDTGKAEVTRVKEWSGEKSVRSYEIPAGAYDIAGAMMALRSRPLKPGTVEEVDVFDGSKVFRLRCIVERREQVKVGAGTFDAILTRVQLGFEGNFESKRDLKTWFSADERHLPLRLEAEFVLGSVVAELASARKGVAL
ncbi:ATP-dependent exoDNAse (exonuclease V) alpha subunit - helicase superfamily I member [Vulgatibacter incomptus]|uniref:ATP-dependent exoDNAse (Exonuclease V) alpha subunit-helicase superfamily I member n=1 Tax=Vulgatibacter incomptus TaxID=1391653 RepID=A0A0K1PCU2_9BACT|nr:ATP-dependent exoDNAse (exonuclease V) alpha subunit - helicase superfamily I member [Vulgatibacter incomptus]